MVEKNKGNEDKIIKRFIGKVIAGICIILFNVFLVITAIGLNLLFLDNVSTEFFEYLTPSFGFWVAVCLLVINAFLIYCVLSYVIITCVDKIECYWKKELDKGLGIFK